MKKFLILLYLTIVTTLFANAQSKMPTAEEIAKKNVDELETRLKLTSTQKSVVYYYAFNLAKEQLELFKKQQANGYKDEEVTKFYRLNNETHKSIKAVLKPDQVIEYDKLTEERLAGIDSKKKKKRKKGEEEEKIVGIEGLKMGAGQP